jgi:hypothetical protein
MKKKKEKRCVQDIPILTKRQQCLKNMIEEKTKECTFKPKIEELPTGSKYN